LVSAFFISACFAAACAVAVAATTRAPSRVLWTVAIAAGAVWIAAYAAPLFAPDLASQSRDLSIAVRTLDALRLFALAWAVVGSISFLKSGRPSLAPVDARDRAMLAAFAAGSLATAAAPAGVAASFASIGLAVGGVAVARALWAHAEGRARWGATFLVIGAGSVFAFDLIYFGGVAIAGSAAESVYFSRPFVAAIACALLAVGARRFSSVKVLSVGLNRRSIIGGATLLACGVYLVAVSAAGALFRRFDLEWGGVAQTVFVAASAMALAIMLSSDQIRARARTFFARNFLRDAYDYRAEWSRFVDVMSEDARGDGSSSRIYPRAVRAVADPFDCSSGSLFVRDRHGGLAFACDWHWDAPPEARSAPASVVEAAAAIVASGEAAADLSGGEPLGAGEEAERFVRAHGDARLALPLASDGVLIGLVVLRQPRAARTLTTEDRELLSIFSRQLGSMIAEEDMARALEDARRFERISRNFSFVAHDLKNILSQLSLIVQQAEKHGDNPAFQRDAMLTVGESVAAMERLLSRLRQARQGEEEALETVDLGVVARDVLARKGAVIGRVRDGGVADGLIVTADPTGLASVVDNLVQNAVDATASGGEVEARAYARGGDVVLEVCDTGCGMSAAFIRDELFRPFRSTKDAGFGIGMFQCREWVERWGGRLDVASAPGEGATATVILPAASGPRIARTGRADAEGAAAVGMVE